MANKKKGTKGRRRGRVGAIRTATKEVATTILGVVAGSIAKRMLSNAIAGQTAVTVDPRLLNGGFLIVGGIVAAKSRNKLIASLGLGMAGQSGLELAQSLGVIKGIGASGFYLLPKPASVNGGATYIDTVGQAPGNSRSNVYNFPGPGNVGRSANRIRKYAGAGM